MTNEELLEKAKKDYPIGTYYASAGGGNGKYIVEEKDELEHPDTLTRFGQGCIGIKGKGFIKHKDEWAEIISKPEQKPSKVLIFNDIYVGDIVVSHQVTVETSDRSRGDMFKVLEKSNSTQLYYKENTQSGRKGDWRKATPEEEEAYNKGIRNIKDIPASVISPRFEKGKWYTESSRPLLYIKFDRFLPNDSDAIYSSEKIYQGYHQYIANDLWLSKDVNWVLADVSIIQEYLPEGHVDKIPSTYAPKIGDYLTVRGMNHLSGKMMIILYQNEYNSKKDPIRCGGPIISDFPKGYGDERLTFKKEGSCCFKSDDRDFKFSNDEEKQWLQACIKANKFIPKEEALKSSEEKLGEFPSDGQCKIDDKLINYLRNCPIRSFTAGGIALEKAKGVAWNSNSYWYFSAASGKKEYKLEELEKFLPKLETMDLLEEAKNKYPVGTKYWNLDMAGNRSNPGINIEDLPEIPEGVKFIFGDTKSHDGKPVVLVKGPKTTHGWVYSNGVWAEIISSIPEYVECISSYFIEKDMVGKIFKTSDGFPVHLKECQNLTWEKVWGAWKNNKFGPSTKEAYEAQNKPNVMEKEMPKKGEFWIYKRKDPLNSKLHSSDSLYEILEIEGNKGKIKHLWEGSKRDDASQNYTFDLHPTSLWRKATPQDLIDAGITFKEPQLIEGQWYECLLDRQKWIYQYKYLSGRHLLNGSKTSHSRCCKVGESPQKGDNHITNDKYITNVKPANMEEVYKYFPEERPKEKEMNTYGLKVGDVISPKVLSAWVDKRPNKYEDKKWSTGGGYVDDKAIAKFKQIDGITVFQRERTSNDIWFRAEGFKEFMDNFNKPKTTELSSLPDKWYIAPLNEEQFDIVRKHWGDRYSQYTFHQDVNFNYLGDYRKEEGCTLITFEQFKKWVLKEPVKQEVMEDLTGRWLKITKNPYIGDDPRTKVGKYLKITSGKVGHEINTLGDNGYTDFWSYSSRVPDYFEIMPIGWTPETEKVMKYKIGDLVIITNVDNYKTSGIPHEKLIHGTYTLHYIAPNAKIVDIYNEYYIVNYINKENHIMQLGFLEKDITLREDKSKEWILYAKRKFNRGDKVKDLMGYEAVITDDWEVISDSLYNNGNLISQAN